MKEKILKALREAVVIEDTYIFVCNRVKPYAELEDFEEIDEQTLDEWADIIARELKEGGRMSEDNLQNNKCFIDWRGYGEDSEPYCEPCDIELFDEWNHCPSCGRKIYSYIDGKEIVGWP